RLDTRLGRGSAPRERSRRQRLRGEDGLRRIHAPRDDREIRRGASMSAASPIRVVVVDDSPICSELLRLIVEHEGDAAVVGVANEGERGLEAVKRLRPDLVLLDLRMPGMDGLTLVERIMSEAPTPILVVTADPAGASREGVFE